MARSALAWLIVSLLAHSACRREEPPPEYPPPGSQMGQGFGGTGSQVPPPVPTPTATTTEPPPAAPPPATTAQPAPQGPPATPAGPPPVAGFPCASDGDLQCPFARCIDGRCGGCRTASDCKSGATCAQSPLGMACMPSAGSGAPPPQTPPTTTPPATTPPTSSDPFAAARVRCVQRINEYRAKAKAAPVSQRTDRESCADSQAQSDAAKNTAHGAFGKCSETAQNECPGWKGSVDSVLDSCLQAMFAEGPGTGPAHGHYNNMMDPGYKGAACGFYQAPNGGLWIVHDFYR